MDLTISSYRPQQPAFGNYVKNTTGIFLSSAGNAIKAAGKRNNAEPVVENIQTQFRNLMKQLGIEFSMVGNGDKAEDVMVMFGREGYVDGMPVVNFCKKEGLKGFTALKNVANRIATGDLLPQEINQTFLRRMFKPIETVNKNGRQVTLRSPEQNRITAKQFAEETGNMDLYNELAQKTPIQRSEFIA